MNPLFIYALKVNGSLLLFYLFYMLLYRRDTFLKIRRAYLLIAVLFSFVYPLLQFGAWFQEQKAVQALSTTINLNEVVIFAHKTSPSVFTAENILLSVYVLVAFALIFKIILQIISILVKSQKGIKTKIDGVEVILMKENITPFSFFNYIFINKNQHTEIELPEILTHELSHVRQRHSYDVIVSELLTALCWFNPFAWLLKKEIKQNLEFLADNQVINSGFETKKYQYLLLNISCNYVDNQLINQFNISPIKKRITMMNKPKTSGKGLIKYTLIIPVVLTMLIINNAQNAMAELQKNNQKKSSVPKKETVKFVAPKKIKGDLKMETVRFTTPVIKGDTVYEVTDIPPAFPGGDDALMKYLSSSIKYPADAIKNNIQGRVTLQFIVDETGKVINPKIVRGVSPSIDNEALRVVSSMPNWTPGKEKGKNVKCKFYIPINFKLATEKNLILSNDTISDEKVFELLENPPSFPGGDAALMRYLSQNIKYPVKAQEYGVMGKIFVQFIVDTNGEIKDVHSIKNIFTLIETKKISKKNKSNSGNNQDVLTDNDTSFGIDNAKSDMVYEAIRVIKAMPNWIPGQQKGKNEKCKFFVPINFKLQ